MATVATCPLPGEPGMYGLGIRVGFYIQWFGLVVVEYIDETELADVRLLSVLSSAAAALALVIRLSMGQLQPADIYIVLLLATGAYLFLVPLYAWKALTCCSPYWDPQRWTRESQSPIYKGSSFALLLTLAGLQVWFWCGYAAVERWTCDQYGFFFSQVPLGNRVFISFNAILYLLIVIVCVGILLAKSGCEMGSWRRKRRRRRISKVHAVALQELKAFSNLAVAAVLTAAVELSIVWNNIPGVNWVTDVGQTLPIVVSAGIVLRVLFLHYAKGDDDSDSDSGSSVAARSSHYAATASHRSYRRPSSGGPAWPSAGRVV